MAKACFQKGNRINSNQYFYFYYLISSCSLFTSNILELQYPYIWMRIKQHGWTIAGWIKPFSGFPTLKPAVYHTGLVLFRTSNILLREKHRSLSTEDSQFLFRHFPHTHTPFHGDTSVNQEGKRLTDDKQHYRDILSNEWQIINLFIMLTSGFFVLTQDVATLLKDNEQMYSYFFYTLFSWMLQPHC